MMRPHVVRVRFSAEPTVTQKQAGELWAIGNEFGRFGAGVFRWEAECKAHTPQHALEWAENRVRSVLGEAARIEWHGMCAERVQGFDR